MRESDAAGAEFIEIVEELLNAHALLLDDAADARHHVIHIDRGVIDDLSSDSARGCLDKRVDSFLVEVLAHSEYILGAVYIRTEAHVIDVISVASVHVELKD